MKISEKCHVFCCLKNEKLRLSLGKLDHQMKKGNDPDYLAIVLYSPTEKIIELNKLYDEPLKDISINVGQIENAIQYS